MTSTREIDALYCLHACLSHKTIGSEIQGGSAWIEAQLEAIDEEIQHDSMELPSLFIPILRLWGKRYFTLSYHLKKKKMALTYFSSFSFFGIP